MHDRDSTDAVELHPEDYSVDDLRAVLFGDSARLPKVFALNLLRRMDYPGRVADLERVVASPEEAPALRRQAAVELGRLPSEEAAAALERVATVDSPAVRETVARELATHPAAARRPRPAAAAWHDRLDAIRRGAPGARLAVPTAERLLTLGAAAVEVTVEPAPAELAAEALRQVADRLADELSAEGAVSFRARRTGVLFLPGARRPASAAGGLPEAPAVLGAVLLRPGYESDRWELGYHVVTQPSEGGEGAFDILVVRPSGELAFAGRATPEQGPRGAGLAFRVSAVDVPGGFPVEVAGRFGPGGLELDQVRVGTAASTVTPQPRPR